MDDTDPRSLGQLITAVMSELPTLVRKESELIRAEVGEKLSQASKAAVQLGVGAAMLLGAFLVLLQGLVLALSKVMDPLWASVLVGAVVGLLGFFLVRGAAKKISPAEMTPDRSARQLQKDAQLVKEQVK